MRTWSAPSTLLLGALLAVSVRSGLGDARGASRGAVRVNGARDVREPYQAGGGARSWAANRLRGGDAPMAAPAGEQIEPPIRAPRRDKKKAEASAAKKPPAEEPVAVAAACRPNELTIEAGDADQDGSTALLHPKKLEALGLMEGDIVRLKGRRDRETLCMVQESAKVCEFAKRCSALLLAVCAHVSVGCCHLARPLAS